MRTVALTSRRSNAIITNDKMNKLIRANKLVEKTKLEMKKLEKINMYMVVNHAWNSFHGEGVEDS